MADIPLSKLIGSGGTPLGGIIQLAPSYPPSVELDGSLFLKNGFGTTDFDPSLTPSPLGELWGAADTASSSQLNNIVASGNTVVAVGNNGLVLVSTDAGETWQQKAAGLTSQNITALATNDSGVWVARAAAGQVIRSGDNGQNWSLVTTVSTFPALSIAARGNVFIAAVSTGNNLIRSNDAGLTWSQIPSGSASNTSVIAVSAAGTWMLGGPSVLLRSTNNFDTSSVIASASAGVSISSGGGQLWLISSSTSSSHDVRYSNNDGVSFGGPVSIGANLSSAKAVYIGGKWYITNGSGVVIGNSTFTAWSNNIPVSEPNLSALSLTKTSDQRIIACGGSIGVQQQRNFISFSEQGFGINLDVANRDTYYVRYR